MRQAFFITSTIHQWIPLFHKPELAEIILEALVNRAGRGQIKINAYVIMPNHVHKIVSLQDGLALPDYLRDFHKFTARRIIDALVKDEAPELARMRVSGRDRKIQVWRKTHSPRQLISWKFFRQKLEYIHNNPLSPKWRLCERPEEYAYFNAGAYLAASLGEEGSGAGKIPLEIITPWTPW